VSELCLKACSGRANVDRIRKYDGYQSIEIRSTEEK